MHGGSGITSGRTELLVVLVIALTGVAAAAAVALAPWHPTGFGQQGDTSAVIQLDPPPNRIESHGRSRVDPR
jgi:hypothetical protein